VQRSLSVLLPVKDAQATLAASVHDILDVVADSIERYELTYHYPQVRVIRHGTSLGREAAIRTGLKRCRGEVVVMRDESRGFRMLERPADLARQTPSRPARPNYLSRLRGFVFSE
jgi:hypothetical protein